MIWQIENDPHCLKVLEARWPDTKRYGDIVNVEAAGLVRPRVLCGGFPCQDVSSAGTRKGLTGARSGLWRQYARLIRALAPDFVVVENVSALRSRGLSTVLADLAACGFDAVWDCLPAAAVGAPHRRDRLFVVAWRVPHADGVQVRDQSERGEGSAQESDGGNPLPSDLGVKHVALAECDGLQGGGPDLRQETGDSYGEGMGPLADSNRWRHEALRIANREPEDSCAPRHDADGRYLPIWPPGPSDMLAWERVPASFTPSVCRVAEPVSRGMDRRRLKQIGNAVVPAVAEVIGRLIVAQEEFLRAA